MPHLRDHLISCATNEGLSLPVFIATKMPKGCLPPLIITYQQADSSDDEPTAKQKIDLQCDQVEHEAVQKYVDRLRFMVGKNHLLIQLAVDFHSQTSKRMAAALPTESQMASLQRARTAEQKLMTQSTGELLELQRRRKRAVRSLQSG